MVLSFLGFLLGIVGLIKGRIKLLKIFGRKDVFKFILTSVAVMFFALSMINPGEVELDVTGNLEVHYLDVGQADCILVKLPDGQTILIDGGDNGDEDIILDYLRKIRVRKVDHLIGTHPHADHIGGLATVITTLDIGKIYLPRVVHTTKTYENLLKSIQAKDMKVTEARAGVELDLGEGVTGLFVAPNSDNYRSLNDYSAVLKLSFGQTGFLFTGDAEKLSEDEMLDNYPYQLAADVLKVGHHGSVTSSSPAFIAAVNPSYSIISAGQDNTYGHPHREIVERLGECSEIYRTDLDGTIIVTSDGRDISFQTTE